MATRTSAKCSVPYSILHNLSSVDILYDEKKKKMKPRIVGVFEAERLIARRKDKKVNNLEFNFALYYIKLSNFINENTVLLYSMFNKSLPHIKDMI